MTTDPPLQALEAALADTEAAMQAALAEMIRDPALVSLLAHRLLKAASMIHKARKKLGGH